jgi:hypothetical protein
LEACCVRRDCLKRDDGARPAKSDAGQFAKLRLVADVARSVWA